MFWRKFGKSEFSLKFRPKTPTVGFKVEVSGETLNFELKVRSLKFQPET